MVKAVIRYFAEIDRENVVLRVIVVRSARYAKKLLGGYRWVETFQGRSDKNYCSRGWVYVDKLKNFYNPKSYEGWVLDEVTLRWRPREVDGSIIILPREIKPRVIVSEDRKIYRWDNDGLMWREVK